MKGFKIYLLHLPISYLFIALYVYEGSLESPQICNMENTGIYGWFFARQPSYTDTLKEYLMMGNRKIICGTALPQIVEFLLPHW